MKRALLSVLTLLIANEVRGVIVAALWIASGGAASSVLAVKAIVLKALIP